MGKTRVSPTPGTAAESKTEIQPPSMYKVVLLNDDYTPMDFVVEVLQRFFPDGSGKGDAGHAGCAL